MIGSENMGFRMVVSVLGAMCLAVVCILLGKKLSDREHKSEKSDGVQFFLSIPFWIALVLTLSFLVMFLMIEALYTNEHGTKIWSPETAMSITKEFFFASFIALFIIATVEVVSRREQSTYLKNVTERQTSFVREATEEAQKSVISAVYKSRMSPAIFDAVEKTVFQSKFLREKHERNLIIESIAGDEKYVKISVTQEYYVRNVTGSPQDSKQKMYIPNSSNPHFALTRIVSFTPICIEGECKIPVDYPYGSDSSENISRIDSLRHNTPDGAESVYSFPPIEVGPNALLKVTLEMVLAKDISDNEIMTFLSPTLRGQFSVRSEVDNIDINAISLHRGELKPSIGNTPKQKSWTFDNPMLPYQRYVVFWRIRQ